MAEGNDESLKRAVSAAAVDGRIECATALALATELGIPPRSVGKAANQLGVKIARCQLGCFG